MPRAYERQFLIEVLVGDQEAIEFVEQVFRISQVWDDLADGERVQSKDLDQAFWEAITLPERGFYARHYERLAPILQAAMADWMAANWLERTDEHGQNIAWAIRDNLASLVIQCAYLIGGFGWMREKAPLIREHIHEESLEAYKEDL